MSAAITVVCVINSILIHPQSNLNKDSCRVLATHILIGWLSLHTRVIEHCGSCLGEARQVTLFFPLLDEESETLTAQTWGGPPVPPRLPPALSYPMCLTLKVVVHAMSASSSRTECQEPGTSAVLFTPGALVPGT